MNSPINLRVLTRSEHNIQDSAIDPDAWKVLRRLHGAGHTAYLVGGTVRDLFLGRKPKDFDVATTARPNDIKHLFRNAFMIGRRFRLAHIKFHDNIIEVATFRRESDRFEEPQEGGEAKPIRLYGTPEEDARRRDFTINGLFYDPFLGNIIDYVNGLDDMGKRLVRTITPATASFQEDPARMMRAVRATARLGFVLDGDTREAIVQHRTDILRCPKARILDELLILLKHSSAERSLRLLWQLGLTEYILPTLHSYLIRHNHVLFEPPKTDVLFDLLAMLDLETEPVNPPVLYAFLIFPLILERLDIFPNAFWETRNIGLLIKAVESSLEDMSKDIDISKRHRAATLDLLTIQPRLYLRQSHARPEKIAFKQYFQDGFRFFCVGTRATDIDVQDEISVWNKFKTVQNTNSIQKVRQKHGRRHDHIRRKWSNPKTTGESRHPGSGSHHHKAPDNTTQS